MLLITCGYTISPVVKQLLAQVRDRVRVRVRVRLRLRVRVRVRVRG